MIGAVTRMFSIDLPGAVADPETHVALHFGDPLAEQRALADTPTLIDRSYHDVIAVSGPDAASFLNNLLSQKLDDVAAGFGAFALDLNAQGHILHHVGVMFDGSTFYLDMLPQQKASFLEFLQRMVFWSDVTIEETDLVLVSTLGRPLDGAVATRTRRFGSFLLHDALLSPTTVTPTLDAWQADGGRVAGLMAYTAARVRAVEPELGVDLDERSIPHEAPTLIGRGDHLGAVHLHKGCYRGQETVARVENLGRSPRLLVMLQLDGSAPELPAPGAEITLGGRKVGQLGTVVQDADYGPIALALVKRSALTDPAVPLDISGVAANVDPDSLPAEEGERAGRAAIDKLRGGVNPRR